MLSELSSSGSNVSPALTPMMKQWSELKAQAANALLFFRLGDFYELFDEDAVTAAPLLGVALTARNKSAANSIPLCGVPVASIENYLTKVLDRGFKIALAEQTEEPGEGKNIVRREIVQWFTPGIRFLASDERSHYLGVVTGKPNAWNLAAADVSTGHFVFESLITDERLAELMDQLPIEDLRSENLDLLQMAPKFFEPSHLVNFLDSEKILKEAFGINDLAELPAKNKMEIQTLGSLIHILNEAHPREKLRFLVPRADRDAVWVSAATRKNLHLFEPAEKSLFEFLNRTQTAMGRRELKFLLASPTQNREVLKERQNLVRAFKKNSEARRDFRTHLYGTLDLHRLMRRMKDAESLCQLQKSLNQIFESAVSLNFEAPLVISLKKSLAQLQNLTTELNKNIQKSESETGWIQTGVNAELDELRTLKQNANQILLQLEDSLRTETKVSGLKIKFHQVFGYVAEVTAMHKEKIPARAKRIQTLANSERFKTDELVSLEEKLLSLDLRIQEAEKSEILRLLDLAQQNEKIILNLAESLGKLDCFQSLAEVSTLQRWSTPKTLNASENSQIKLKSARHPLSISAFVPLSFSLSTETEQILLLTGPNMSGKSTLLRVAAVCALLHQIGSDIPAESAELSLFDRIVCRMGAQDDLTSGQSTFFVEMREVASMLRGATDRSLLIFDEIGRGTSTYDGMSLAWAITEEVHEKKSISLIATHYLELAELEKTLARLQSYHLGVEEIDHKLIFTRELKQGPASRSYGIQVARLADIPSSVLIRADQKLKELERKSQRLHTRAGPLFEMEAHR
ncbi:MAG: DNA mismatch repair protein MutS [Deltaproteobacteria bacterium]|nr:DNA mismatch repair protein MutS [Deltaproteobacteria bacterium]